MARWLPSMQSSAAENHRDRFWNVRSASQQSPEASGTSKGNLMKVCLRLGRLV